MVETAALLVDHVLPHRPFRQWVLSFPYPLRFVLANHPQVMGKVLAIVNRAISTHLINKAGFKVSQAHTGAVTLIQRFGSALNLNLHFHVLFIDGVFSLKGNGQLRFHRVNAPTSKELNALVAAISERVARYLERQGWLARDEQSDHLTLALEEGDEDTLQQLQGHSITYRIAMGPHAGRKVLTLQTIPAREEEEYGTDQLGRIGGFSLHAGVAVNTRERKKLERICRYISRPALSEARLELTDRGMVRYALKTAYRDGTTHVVFEPLDFMAKLAALVPRPRTNLTRFHGVLAPNSRYRDRVTPVSSGKVKKPTADADAEADGRQEPDLTASKRKGMCWAQRLKRVFNMDVSICSACGGPMKIIASIEDPFVIGKILSHLEAMFGSQGPENRRPGARAPPPAFC